MSSSGTCRSWRCARYALASCSSADMLDVVRHHQFALTRRHGVWERLEGPELGRALAQVRRLNADLERRVEERTTELTTANAQLQNEIADARKVEEALSEREEFQRLLTENTGEFVRFFDPSGKLVYANPAVKRTLARSRPTSPDFLTPRTSNALCSGSSTSWPEATVSCNGASARRTVSGAGWRRGAT